jgi:hypothetical protein
VWVEIEGIQLLLRQLLLLILLIVNIDWSTTRRVDHIGKIICAGCLRLVGQVLEVRGHPLPWEVGTSHWALIAHL